MRGRVAKKERRSVEGNSNTLLLLYRNAFEGKKEKRGKIWVLNRAQLSIRWSGKKKDPALSTSNTKKKEEKRKD